jgi:ABC-type branched-subunit amino acid transport system permease subunit
VPGGNLIALGVVLMLTALFLRRGIFGAVQSAWHRLRRPAL